MRSADVIVARMSKETRADRRRGNPSASKAKKRIITGPVVAFVVLVLLVAGVAVFQNSLHSADVNAVSATPTPNATGSEDAGAIQLVDGKAIGAAVLSGGDTASGGQGNPVDDIACAAQEFATLHVHAHIALFDHGKQIQIPSGVGIASSTRCLYWVHTHDATGIIHIEAPIFRAFTLGNFFDIWGQPLSTTHIAMFTGTVKSYVNGALYDADPRGIPLRAHQQITLEVGPPFVDPPRYRFPKVE